MKIYAVNSRVQLSDVLYQECLKWIEPYFRERILRYRFWEERQRSLLGRLLTRYAIIKNFCINNNDITIVENKYGKPFLFGDNKISFNVSHSKDWVVCAINTSAIGIDVQEIKDMKLSIADRFFTKQENDYLASLNEKEQLHGFYDIWSLKEAYIKALGLGLSMPLKEFSIIKSLDSIQVKCVKDNDFYFKQYDIGEEYKLSVCSKDNCFSNTFERLVVDDIWSVFQ